MSRNPGQTRSSSRTGGLRESVLSLHEVAGSNPYITGTVIVVLAIAWPITLITLAALSPALIGIAGLMYFNANFLYLVYAQPENDSSQRILPYFVVHPLRVFKVNVALMNKIFAFFSGHKPVMIARWIFHKLLQRRGGSASEVWWVHIENIKYNLYNPLLTLDVHCRSHWCKSDGLRPVIIFVYGSGWGRRNKKHYQPLGETLEQAGFVVVIPDLTRFPEGKIGTTVTDLSKAILWTHNYIESYGGDPSQIYLMGHSLGAHVTALTLVHDLVCYVSTRFESESGSRRISVEKGKGELPFLEDSLPQIQGVMLLGVEDLCSTSRMMGSTLASQASASPLTLLRRLDPQLIENGEAKGLLPKNWILVHGDADITCPASESIEFHKFLKQNLGISKAKLRIYHNYDNTRTTIEISNLVKESRDINLEYHRLQSSHVSIDGHYHHSTSKPSFPDNISAWIKNIEAKPARMNYNDSMLSGVPKDVGPYVNGGIWKGERVNDAAKEDRPPVSRNGQVNGLSG
ncbi:hypothetical protein HDU76_012353 [Blyttiomyces sp. JEL0837]|nr:hypothetical protein HDU76_012353 [Blyttiomyces sp. JEL0837]